MAVYRVHSAFLLYTERSTCTINYKAMKFLFQLLCILAKCCVKANLRPLFK